MQAMAKSTLSSLVQDHLTALVSEAACVQRHSKRARYHASSDNSQGILRRRLDAQDINLALQWRGSEKLYGSLVNASPTDPVDLNAYVKSENQLGPPSELGLESHWLAVDGTACGTLSSKVETRDEDPRAVTIRQLLPRLLSEELQLYFSRITIAVERDTARQAQDAALASVARDQGIQELVPFFCRYISGQLLEHVGNVEHCRTLVRLTKALFSNPNLHLELQLHQLLPALITCVVAKRLSSRPSDNHWALRMEAAQVLLQACDLFGEEYTTLQARVLKTLVEATAPEKPLPTQYGGIVGLTLFGPKAVDAFVLPLAVPYWRQWEEALKTTNDLQERSEIHMCQQAMLDALAVFLQGVSPAEQAARISYEELENVFGEKLIVLQNEPTKYAMCTV